MLWLDFSLHMKYTTTFRLFIIDGGAGAGDDGLVDTSKMQHIRKSFVEVLTF